MKIKEVVSKKEWENFVSSQKDANFLQSWQWGEFHKDRGMIIFRRGLYDDGKLIGVYTGHVSTPRSGKRLEIPGGPLIDWKNDEVVKITTKDLLDLTKSNKAVFARIRPQAELSEDLIKTLNYNNYKKSPIYLSVELAGILDLTKSEEELLKGMRQRLRRALRKAAKNNITIETSVNPEDIDTFYNIQLETAKRQEFVSFQKDYLKKQFEAFAKEGQAILYTAKHKGEILAQNFMIFYGNEASYHYGVSTKLGTKLSGAPVLHMRAMEEARKRGINRYNFWGIVPEDSLDHRFYGVSVFKRGFGVDELQHVPAHDLVVSPIRYILSWIIEDSRRRIRKV